MTFHSLNCASDEQDRVTLRANQQELRSDMADNSYAREKEIISHPNFWLSSASSSLTKIMAWLCSGG